MMMLGTVILFGLLAVLGVVALVLFLAKRAGAPTLPGTAFTGSSQEQNPVRTSPGNGARSCSHCGAGLQPDWSHCPQCGAPIQ